MPHQKKKLVLLLDGSWFSRTQALVRGLQSRLETQYLGNVALLAQAIKMEDADGIPQITFYQNGVGTSTGFLTNIISGATGIGLSENLIEAYSFIVDNYRAGDEIFLFGFSRGAYTARALSGFILWAGIMSKAQLAFIRPIYQAYCRRSPSKPEETDWAARVLFYFTGTWPSEESTRVEGQEIDKRKQSCVRDPERLEAQRSGPQVEPPQIKFIGVMDTVGALGVPGQFGTPWARRQFEFFDTGLSSNIKNAYQALALSENRKDFAPTLWDNFDPSIGNRMKQVWHIGSHGDVGGGHPHHGLSDIVLASLCAQLTDHPEGALLALDLEHIKAVQDRTEAWAQQEPYRSRSWFMGREARQVCRNVKPQAGTATTGENATNGSGGSEGPNWANEVPQGPNREMLHHSVVVCGRYDIAHSEEFKTLRAANPELLRSLWDRAADEATLLPTERYLLWGAPEPLRPPPLSDSTWARAPAHLSPDGVKRYLAFKDAVMYFKDGVGVGVQVVTWPLVVVLNTIVSRSTSTENLSGKPPSKPAREALKFFKKGADKLKEAITGRWAKEP
ncbi:unnamed protein product [Tilletia controversa]|uniref:T6SS Phospholipase effector Tle1-like catalytic domain-containing protein n=3 Tax=Tilletia TaxID=13289 RepID=A0A8X7MRT6_9BASI|nr:hypothetical protein CF336_g4854 [Tilletia laevis]KAE8195396.1 hypothetical protein CF328_g4451 [Tilletia controversa]KAE8259192.1 hypothetical protein A4X03_0g4168 [Tilletia caries]KAE8199849.1 hypothetical protein CF335_g4073 [Tilletia laevis]KAE8246033.1 hypothetical protein A4X06_0g5238 [Tilletia controversa]